MPTRLILVEGPDDCSFVRALIDARRIERNGARIADPSSEHDRTGGNTKFGRKLAALKLERAPIRPDRVLIITDSDTDPQDSFDKARRQVERAHGGRAPTQVREPSAGPPSITIVTIPFDEPGTLETLCARAARNYSKQITDSVDFFDNNIRAERWQNEIRRSKFWLRSMLAASCGDPGVPLGQVFSEARFAGRIPLADPVFNPLADLIRRSCED
jgi:hypothetical protein